MTMGYRNFLGSRSLPVVSEENAEQDEPCIRPRHVTLYLHSIHSKEFAGRRICLRLSDDVRHDLLMTIAATIYISYRVFVSTLRT